MVGLFGGFAKCRRLTASNSPSETVRKVPVPYFRTSEPKMTRLGSTSEARRYREAGNFSGMQLACYEKCRGDTSSAAIDEGRERLGLPTYRDASVSQRDEHCGKRFQS